MKSWFCGQAFFDVDKGTYCAVTFPHHCVLWKVGIAHIWSYLYKSPICFSQKPAYFLQFSASFCQLNWILWAMFKLDLSLNHHLLVTAFHRQVLIVGGGLSGLCCALAAAKRGASVRLFEASFHILFQDCYKVWITWNSKSLDIWNLTKIGISLMYIYYSLSILKIAWFDWFARPKAPCVAPLADQQCTAS